jgi:hypothetical protein
MTYDTDESGRPVSVYCPDAFYPVVGALTLVFLFIWGPYMWQGLLPIWLGLPITLIPAGGMYLSYRRDRASAIEEFSQKELAALLKCAKAHDIKLPKPPRGNYAKITQQELYVWSKAANQALNEQARSQPEEATA